MKLNKRFASILLLVGLLVGGLVAGIAFTGSPAPAAAQSTDACVEDDDSQEASETEDADDVQEEVECGPQDENEADAADSSEVEDGQEDAVTDTEDEMAPDNLAITADQAQTIVEDANPGAATLAVEFDHENGKDIWEVELDNGQDVKVDAASGQILLTEVRD